MRRCNRWTVALVAGLALVAARGGVARADILVTFYDLNDGKPVVTVDGINNAVIRTAGETAGVRLPKVLPPPAGQYLPTRRFYTLTEPAGDPALPQGSISDIIEFDTRKNSTDYVIRFRSDRDKRPLSLPAGASAYGTAEETGGFQLIPLPPDSPMTSSLTVYAASDVPNSVPEPATLVLASMAGALCGARAWWRHRRGRGGG